MKRNIIYPALLAASVGMLAGCAAQRGGRAVTVNPSPCTLIPDSAGMTRMQVTFNVPGNYFSTRSRLVIAPQLVAGDTVLDEYEPLVLDAPIYSKKKRRMEVLDGYEDPYAAQVVKIEKLSETITIPYYSEPVIPEGVDNARVVGVVSNDGCGQCTGIDTIDIARVTIPATLRDMKLALLTPAGHNRPKVHHGKGEARLQFIVDKWNIVMDLADNRRELTGMLETLRPILEDSLATLTSLNIFGSASAEASYAHNMALANRRATSAKNWLVSQLNLPAEVQGIIKTGAAPEGWEPVVQAMIAAGDADSVKVRELMVKYPGPTDDAAEWHIRRLACWPRIKQHYLAPDRKVLYDYTWTIRSFTDDAELLDMYSKRPDAFNEEEMLRVSTLMPDDKSRMEVYETILRYFPDSHVAANNLAILYLNDDRTDDARRVLLSRDTLTPEMVNTLAAINVHTRNYPRAIGLLKSVDLPEARHNLELLMSRLREAGADTGDFDSINK